jgi:hypothetical protein
MITIVRLEIVNLRKCLEGNNMENEITMIKIQLKTKAIELSTEEARLLFVELNKLFISALPEKEQKELPPTILYPAYPAYLLQYKPPQPWEPTPWTFCKTTNTLCMNLNQ